jgi:hypothetical protein
MDAWQGGAASERCSCRHGRRRSTIHAEDGYSARHAGDATVKRRIRKQCSFARSQGKVSDRLLGVIRDSPFGYIHGDLHGAC